MTQPECSIPCNLCGSTEVSRLATKDRDGAPLRTVICVRCGLVWSDPRPIEARRYYEEDYRKDYKKVERPRLIHIYRAGRVALDRWARIKKFIPEEARLLDAGSGGGQFLYLMQRLGMRATGIEPNRGYADFSREEYGLDVKAGFLSDMKFTEGKFHVVTFHVITMWHALEHTEDPSAIFRRVRDWLKAGGLFVVEVPNVEATCISPGNRFHRAHLYSFNRVTLCQLGELAGFTVEESSLTEDGGNIWAVFRKQTGSASEPVPLPTKENARQIQTTLRRHTHLRHLLTHYPYTRPLQRLRNSLHERRAVKGRNGGKEILDGLFEYIQ